MHQKSTHAHPLAWANKNVLLEEHGSHRPQMGPTLSIQYVPRTVFSTTKVHDTCSIGANVSQEKGLRLMHQASLGINV